MSIMHKSFKRTAVCNPDQTPFGEDETMSLRFDDAPAQANRSVGNDHSLHVLIT